MATEKDYYKILGVEKTATTEEIRKAFKKLALKYHPDKNQGDKQAEEKFKEINQAHTVLIDAQERAKYDQFGASGASYGGGRGGGFESFEFSNANDLFKNIFKDLFTQGQGEESQDRNRYSGETNKGDNLRYDLSISLEEAFKGIEAQIAYTAKFKCVQCEGTGSAVKAAPIECSTCHGSGYIRTQQGYFTVERTCNVCYGVGKIIQNPCTRCAGEGRRRQEIQLSVPIPAGVSEGERVTINGKGEAGIRGGKAGNLYVYITIKPHAFFTRDKHNKNNILCEIPVKMTLATLGGQVEVPTIEGTKVKLTIPEGTQYGENLRLKSKGMSILNSSLRGDMIVKILVETPVKLTPKLRELLEQFEKEATGVSPKVTKFLEKMKDLWRFQW